MDFEKSFSDFLESKGCDKMQDTVFTLLRQAYLAGWTAAGGDEKRSDPPGE